MTLFDPDTFGLVPATAQSSARARGGRPTFAKSGAGFARTSGRRKSCLCLARSRLRRWCAVVFVFGLLIGAGIAAMVGGQDTCTS
jgi:hypothetical protein